MNKSSRIKLNQELIRVLNPDAKIEYPVEYASLDNNAVFAAARIINSLGFDFLNYEDIFKQDFLAAAGYVKHYTTDDEDYEKRGRADCSKKLFYRIEKGTIEKATLEEAAEYNQRMVNELYPVIWSYCSRNIMNHAAECASVNQQSLQRVFSTQLNGSLYSAAIDCINNGAIPINTPCILIPNNNIEESLTEKEIEYYNDLFYGLSSYTDPSLVFAMLPQHIKLYTDGIIKGSAIDKESNRFFSDGIKYIYGLFEQLTISLIQDCCKLINQIKMNTAAGRDINYPVYDTAQVLQQEAINEMVATVEPELFDGLSAEELMASFRKNPYIKDEKEYTDAEMDIVRYIVQDMIDVAKAV